MKQEVYTDYEKTPIEVESTNDYLHDWVFHFNPYRNLWTAIPRDLYNKYWDDCELKGVLRSKDINTLLELLYRSKGDINLINEITNNVKKR